MKIKISLLCILIILISSCVTRPDTIENKTNNQKNSTFTEKVEQIKTKLKKSRIESLKKKWPSLSEKEINAVYSKKIYMGMSRDGLLASWGKPKSINSSVGSWGKHEQFVYPGKNEYERIYVYVENGYITSWQEAF